jgi:hypothetical protein
MKNYWRLTLFLNEFLDLLIQLESCRELELAMLTMSRYCFALSLTLAPQMMGIFEEADPFSGLYFPAGMDMIDYSR